MYKLTYKITYKCLLTNNDFHDIMYKNIRRVTLMVVVEEGTAVCENIYACDCNNKGHS